MQGAIEAVANAGRRWLTRAQVAHLVGISPRTVSRWPVPVIRIGRTVRYDLADVEAFLDGHKQQQARPRPAPGASRAPTTACPKARRKGTPSGSALAADLRGLLGH